MKKLIASISFLSYFIVTTGVVISSHYCMNRLASVQLFEKVPDICGKCGMDTHESSGCCHDTVKVVKLQQDQNKLTISAFQLPAIEPIQSIPSQFLVAFFCNFDNSRHFLNHSPPLLSGSDIYLQINVFRI
jgi:hypothetical protein